MQFSLLFRGVRSLANLGSILAYRPITIDFFFSILARKASRIAKKLDHNLGGRVTEGVGYGKCRV